MKKIMVSLVSVIVLTLAACGSEDTKKTEQQEKEAVEIQVEKDQQAMDSLEKAIQSQIDAVSDDSLMNTDH